MSGNTNIIQLCELDNVDLYSKSGSLTSYANQLCDQETQSIYYKNWQLKNHTEILEVYTPFQSSSIIAYTILKIDANNLLLKAPNGNTYMYVGVQ